MFLWKRSVSSLASAGGSISSTLIIHHVNNELRYRTIQHDGGKSTCMMPSGIVSRYTRVGDQLTSRESRCSGGRLR